MPRRRASATIIPVTTASVASVDLRITLVDLAPEIWRLVRVPHDIRMDRLHTVTQAAFGWQNYHLHQFHVVGADGHTLAYIGVPDPEFPDGYDNGGPMTQDERQHQLNEFLHEGGDRLVYEYDFGDCWMHAIDFLGVVAQTTRLPRALCLDGARACPPEDSGGTFVYDEKLAILADPAHEEHTDIIAWIGEGFDPTAFDPVAANRRLLRAKV